MNVKKIIDFTKKLRAISGIASLFAFNERTYKNTVNEKYKNRHHERNLLLTQVENLDIFHKHLQEMLGSKKDLPMEEFLKYARDISERISFYEKKLRELQNSSDDPYTPTETKFYIDMIQINIQQLDVLAQIAQHKLKAKPGSKLHIDMEQSTKMDEALFKVDAQLPAIKELIQISLLKIKKNADPVEEILASGNEIWNQYNKHHNNKTSLANNLNPKLYWTLKRFQKPFRMLQLDLLCDCLKDLKDTPESMLSSNQKAQIAKGLLLVIKHQIDKELFSSNSQLKKMIDEILSRDVMRKIDNTQAIDQFTVYMEKNKTYDKTSHMWNTIQETRADKKWLNQAEKKLSKK